MVRSSARRDATLAWVNVFFSIFISNFCYFIENVYAVCCPYSFRGLGFAVLVYAAFLMLIPGEHATEQRYESR